MRACSLHPSVVAKTLLIIEARVGPVFQLPTKKVNWYLRRPPVIVGGETWTAPLLLGKNMGLPIELSNCVEHFSTKPLQINGEETSLIFTSLKD